jgi:transposase
MTEMAEKRDARKLSREVLEELRRLAVNRVRAGEGQADVARSLQVSRTTVVRWMMAFRAGGSEALAARKPPGRPPTLTEKQRAKLRAIIVGKNPQQLGFGMALWSIRIVTQLIEHRFGAVLHETTVFRLLRSMGLVPRRPTRQAFRRDDAECEHWATEAFPDIVRTAKRQQAVLAFLDETGVHEDAPIGTTWGERGTRPTVRVTGGRARVNVISTITTSGRLWFRCFRGTLNAERFIEFLRGLLQDVRGKIHLVLDKHPAHVSAATRRFLADKRHRIEVHHLPGYAPDLNPDEHVWSYLKAMFRHEPLQDDETLGAAVGNVMEEIRGDRKLVRSFFDHPAVDYVKQALAW